MARRSVGLAPESLLPPWRVDFVFEFLFQTVVQLVVEFVGEALIEGGFHGAARAARSSVARRIASALLGILAGFLWGQHLSGGAHWPKLLWVSLFLAGAAFSLAVSRRGGATQQARPTWRETFAPPWRWSTSRLVDFVVLNLALAVGVALGLAPGR